MYDAKTFTMAEIAASCGVTPDDGLPEHPCPRSRSAWSPWPRHVNVTSAGVVTGRVTTEKYG
jgi:hypothetical protein